MDEMNEAKKRFDEELEAMEQHTRQHGEDQNENTKIISSGRSGNADRHDNGEDRKKDDKEEEVAAPLMEKGEEGGNGGEQLNAKKREDKEETMMTKLVKVVAHQNIQEDGKDKERFLNSQKGVTWSENGDRKEMGTTSTPPTNIAPEQHVSKEKKAVRHLTTGGSKPEICPTDETSSENGKNEEKSKGVKEKKAAPLEGGSWADHTRVVKRPVGEGTGKITMPPKNIFFLLDPVGRTKRRNAEHGGGIKRQNKKIQDAMMKFSGHAGIKKG